MFNVSTSGLGEEVAFSIGAEGPELGKAIDLLVDGIYPNKIGAVVRELCSNAWDSHVAAGRAGTPFDVQLPTAFDPTFRVRDYGVSMSHQDVLHLYTVFFRSSKAQSETLNGKLGLGCKVPFSYVDQFTVTAWLGGEKRIYTAYRDDQRVPRLALAFKDPSDEPDGLEVSFAVKDGDFGTFQMALKRFVFGLDTAPNVTGGSWGATPQFDVLLAGEPLWRLVERQDLLPSGALARMGCVLYPIDPTAIPGITAKQTAVLSASFVIDFATRDLEIAASRESLGYDEKTCRRILEMANLIHEELSSEYAKATSAAASYWDATETYFRFKEYDLDDALRRSIVPKEVRWRGRLVGPRHVDSALEKLVFAGGKHHLTAGGIAVMTASNYTLTRARGGNLKWSPNYYSFGVSDVTKAILVYDDPRVVTSHAGRRLRYWFNHHNWGALFGVPDHVIWAKVVPGSMAWKRLLVALGRPPVDRIFNIADMERPPQLVAKLAAKKRVKMKVLLSGEVKDADIDVSKAHVYIETDRGDVIRPAGAPSSLGGVSRGIDLLAACGVRLPGPVVVVPGTCKRSIRPNWVSLWAVCDKAIAKHYDPVGAQWFNAVSAILSNVTDYLEEFEGAELRRNGPAKKALKLRARLRRLLEQRGQKYALGTALAAAFGRTPDDGHTPETKKWLDDASAARRTFESAYPLLKRLDDHCDIQDKINYINAMDRNRP